MSALSPEADMLIFGIDVRFVPEADIKAVPAPRPLPLSGRVSCGHTPPSTFKHRR